MMGLLLKDFYTLAKQAKIFLLMIVFFAFIPGMSMSVFAVVYATMLPITALAYDERAKWNYLAAMMPYSNRDLVLSKYLLGFITAVGAAVVCLTAQAIVSAVKHTAFEPASLIALLGACCVALVLQAVNLPFMFKLGVERGRLVFLVLFALIALAGMAAGDRISDLFLSSKLHLPTAIAAVAGVTLLVNLLSIRISERVYAFRHA